MKHRCTFIPAFVFAALLFATPLLAQIPNPSFESWSGTHPDGWFTANAAIVYVTQSTDAHDGNTAALSSAQEAFAGFYMVSPLRIGSSWGYYFFCECRPAALRFWYKTNLTSEEELIAMVGGNQNGIGMAGGVAVITNSTNVYTEGIADIIYTQAGNVDSMSIAFSIATTASTGSAGANSWFLVDDLSWGPLASIDETNTAAASLEQIAPNPTRDATNLVYSLTEPADVRLEVYDATGRLIKVILNERQAPGRYKAVEDFSGLSNGVYTCRLLTNETVATKPFVIAR